MLRQCRHLPRIFTRNSAIYALSTNPGKSAIAVVRVSGSSCGDIYKQLTHKDLPKPRQATTATLYDQKRNVLDHALTVYFQGPKSYTGEDLVELHIHGGQAVTRAVLGALKQCKGARYAESGEFTKKAFRNGKLDLTQIEGIRDIIDAETELQRQAAINSGDTKQMYTRWRTQILNSMGMLTALIDFSDDNADITGTLFKDTKKSVERLLNEINKYLSKVQCNELLFSGIKMNLLGPPNAGKSSLINLLAKREAAIVSDIPGTTRDVLEVGLDIAGYKILIGDTAGLRVMESFKDHERIEYEGMRRARERFKEGDLVICVLPATEPLSDELVQEINELKQTKPVLVALNKCDQADEINVQMSARVLDIDEGSIVPISCITGKGVAQLTEKVVDVCKDLTLMSHGPPIGASQRIQDLLENDVIAGLQNVLDTDDVVIATSELQFAIDGIGRITGEGINTEEILGVVFSSFCIGK